MLNIVTSGYTVAFGQMRKADWSTLGRIEFWRFFRREAFGPSYLGHVAEGVV